MDNELRKRIEYELSHWNEPNSEARKRFENAMDYNDKLLAPLKKAIEDSERLTESDYCMRINV